MTTGLSATEISELLNPPPARPDDPTTWHMPPLEDVQLAAAESPEGPLIIMGGAGTGKSEVLLARSVKLVYAGASPNSVATISFNARAARRIKNRLRRIIGGDPTETGFFTGTLHSYCSTLLRQAGWRACGIRPTFSIWDQEQSVATLQNIIAEETGDTAAWMPSEYTSLLEWINRNACLRHEDKIGPEHREWHDYAERYEAEKRSQNSLDFTDLLVKAREALQQDAGLRESYANLRTRHLIIDEFQDLTPIHYEIIKLMRGPTRSLTVAIDPNQSIYQWRGAAPDLLERFRYDHPETRIAGLAINHRTSASVMRAWRRMATNDSMTGLVDDYQRARRPAGRKPEERYVSGNPEMQYRQIAEDIKGMIDSGEFKAEDFAVLCRQRKLLVPISQRIDAAGIRYNVIGEEEHEKDGDAQAIIAMLTLTTNPQNVWALRKGADCNVRKRRRNLNHRITRDIQNLANEKAITMIEAAAEVRQRIDPGDGIHAQLTYAIDTFHELTEMMEQDVQTARLIQRIHDRMYEAGQGRRNNQMNPEVLKLVTLAERADRESDRRATTQERVVGFLERLANASEPDQESEDSDDPTKLNNGVTIATLHSSKGLQWPVVMIADVADHMMPGVRAKDGTVRMEEEQRLLYVGVTRAEDVFYLYWSEQQPDGSKASPSRFIDAMLGRSRATQKIDDEVGNEDDYE